MHRTLPSSGDGNSALTIIFDPFAGSVSPSTSRQIPDHRAWLSSSGFGTTGLWQGMKEGACKVVGWLGCSGPLCRLFLGPKATMPMTERVFQSALEYVDPYIQERLDRVPVPPHLLLLPHPFGDDLVDGGFGQSGRDSQPRTVALAVVGKRIGVRCQLANGVEQRIP